MLIELLLLKEDAPKLIDDIEIAYRSLENFRIKLKNRSEINHSYLIELFDILL